jgi:hypothetical protein
MATSRPIRAGEWLLCLRGDVAAQKIATGNEDPNNYVLQEDFGIHRMDNDPFWLNSGERVFAVPGVRVKSDPRLTAAITNGTAPGLYVREGDDTSDWETYRQVLARRVEEAMATRRGGEGGVGVGETATVTETATTRQDDEIRVGDVVEVVSWRGANTVSYDVGKGGRVTRIEHLPLDTRVHLESVTGRDLPIDNIASLADVRKVSPPSPQTVAVNFSPMPDGEAARIEATVSDEVRRRISSPLASSSDETTRQRVVNPVPPTAGAFTGIITATGPLRRGEPPASALPTTVSPPPLSPSRFSLLEVDADPSADVKAHEPQALKAPVDLAALQAELRAERETKRALAAAQTSPGRFDLLECDLPAVPIAAAVRAPSPCPVVSPPPPLHRNPVETITDLTTARSPLELARMLEGLNDELSTMMRQREAN